MAIRRPAKKRTSLRNIRLRVDPVRLALAAMERIKTTLSRTGHVERFGQPAASKELLAREDLLEAPLPPSYQAAMRVADAIGEPDHLLNFLEMKQAYGLIERQGGGRRYLPVASAPGDAYVCFDRQGEAQGHELPILEWSLGMVRPLATHFGEWLDIVADEREEAIDRAASIPPGLKKLLVQLGFSFDDPIAGRLETGDVPAIEALLGEEQSQLVRGAVDRLFDSSGKASLTLNLDEFTLAVSLRGGIFMFEAEDVFRWLRHFRDENFFGEAPRAPSHPDNVRDLRLAPREPRVIYQGVTEVELAPAQRHTFRAAAGLGEDDYWLLGRTASTASPAVQGRSASLLLHFVGGRLDEAFDVDEPLVDIHVTSDGVLWGLSRAGSALRFGGFGGDDVQRFPLQRPTRGRAAWYGIGHGSDHVLVWGAGALLEFDGEKMSPFLPDAGLLPDESVVALWSSGANAKREIAMLVQGDLVGAVAHFDGTAWRPIAESQVIEASVTDLDVFRNVTTVLDRNGRVWRIAKNGAPRAVTWDRRQNAFQVEENVPRPLHQLRGYDGGTMLATDGGVITVGAEDPVFHLARGASDRARLCRVGVNARRDAPASEGALLALVGPNVWRWEGEQFSPVDVTRW